MTKIFISFLCVVHSIGFANDYIHVDSRVRRYPHFKEIHDLGYRIQNDFKTDKERVRAAFIWLTINMTYERVIEENLNQKVYISFKDERAKHKQLRDIALNKIEKSFALRKGVCTDYSLMLNELCMQFGLPTKVIVGVSKTEINSNISENLIKNHTWNAVQIGGTWQLMDPTWASGFIDTRSKKFVRKHIEHFFFTAPEDFAKHHLPNNEEWQLLREPVSAKEFYSAPYYYPEFFGKGIALSSNTNGILKKSDETINYIYFDKLPPQHGMYYMVHGTGELRRLGFKKLAKNAYVSKIRLKKKLYKDHSLLTVFMDEKPILNFKIEDLYTNQIIKKTPNNEQQKNPNSLDLK